MTHSIRLNRYVPLLPFIIPVLCIIVSKTYLFEEDLITLSAAMTFDLLVTTPVLYFLIIRKRSIPNTTVVPVFILGIVIASIIIPIKHQDYLSLVKLWFLPVLEVSIITYVIIQIRRAFIHIRKQKSNVPDFFLASKETSKYILPSVLALPFATELSVFYYGLFAWKKRPLQSNDFTYHKSTSTSLVLGVFIFLIIIEAVAIHLLLQGWSSVVAWVLTGISIYGCFQILGILKSISRRPISIREDHLFLNWGIMANGAIHLTNIESTQEFKKEVNKKDGYQFLSPFHEMEGHNVLIKLKEPEVIEGFYGIKKTVNQILLFVDEPNLFIEEINKQS